MSRPITRSLPGITREEKMTRSPAPTVKCRCSPAAISDSAEFCSPWLPVDRITWWSAGKSASSSSGSSTPSGRWR